MVSKLCFRTVILFTIAAFFIVSSVDEGSAVRCYRCSSDASDSAFCDDPFDASLISEKQKRWTYVECSYPPSQINPYDLASDQRAVCKKVKQIINDKMIVSRSCFWESVNASKNDCLNHSTPSYIKTIFCETCSTDGCNGAAMDPVVENTIDNRMNAIEEKNNTETSTAVPSKSDLSSDHEVLVTKNITACNGGQDDSNEFVVELVLKIKKSKKGN